MSLHDDVIKVARLYLGPAAERFMNRQITSHLNKTPAELSGNDLQELANWCYVSGRLVMPEERAKEFGEAVRKIRA